MLHIVQIGVRWLLLFSFLILILLFMKEDMREVMGWSAKSMRNTSDVALLVAVVGCRPLEEDERRGGGSAIRFP